MKRIFIIPLIPAILIAAWIFYPEKEIDFNTQVKPILDKNCIVCHGGVRRKSGFSLLFRQDALSPAESGAPAIIPGNPDKSEMIRRITHHDPEERMPYRHDPLSEHEIKILRQWVKEGAKWGDHWAYIPLKPVEVPELSNQATTWAKNEIDLFIWDKWREAKLKPSPEADKATLLRRVSLDLTGLPPNEGFRNNFFATAVFRRMRSWWIPYWLHLIMVSVGPRYGSTWPAMRTPRDMNAMIAGRFGAIATG
jgi:hypothetical protein